MSISLKLNVTAENLQSAVSLCAIARKRIEELYEISKEITAIEIDLFEDVSESMKGAKLHIGTPTFLCEETALAKNWEDAFDKAHEKVASQLFEKFDAVNDLQMNSI